MQLRAAVAGSRRVQWRCAHTLPAASLSPQGYESQLPAGLIASTPSPALFVFMDAVRDNVATMLRHCDGDANRWRPHLKTTKMSPVYLELLKAGVTKFKCATLLEAACLLDTAAAAQNQVDLLVAYPHVEPNLSRLGEMADAHPSRLSVLVEDSEGVAAVPKSLGIFVDVNVGMNRTGQPELEAIVDAAVAASRSGQLRGLHFYDGHLTMADCEERRAQAHDCYDRASTITQTVCAAVAAGSGSGSVEEIVTSGSTTFQDALAYDWRGRGDVDAKIAHTISPGTVVFHDARYDGEVAGLGLKPAALVLSRVISRPTAERVTLDAGSKGIAAEAGLPVAVVLGRVEGKDSLEALQPSEEHLPCRWVAGEPSEAQRAALKRGAHVWLFPRHICPTVNMYDSANLVDGGAVRTVPVDARGH